MKRANPEFRFTDSDEDERTDSTEYDPENPLTISDDDAKSSANESEKPLIFDFGQKDGNKKPRLLLDMITDEDEDSDEDPEFISWEYRNKNAPTETNNDPSDQTSNEKNDQKVADESLKVSDGEPSADDDDDDDQVSEMKDESVQELTEVHDSVDDSVNHVDLAKSEESEIDEEFDVFQGTGNRYWVLANGKGGRPTGKACYNCGKRGHIREECEEQSPCYYCGSREHEAAECFTGSCFLCYRPGHQRADCPRKGRYSGRLSCRRCSLPGHLDSECPDMWREYQWSDEKPASKSVRTWCYNCASNMHWGDDCPRQRSTGSKATSIFSFSPFISHEKLVDMGYTGIAFTKRRQEPRPHSPLRRRDEPRHHREPSPQRRRSPSRSPQTVNQHRSRDEYRRPQSDRPYPERHDRYRDRPYQHRDRPHQHRDRPYQDRPYHERHNDGPRNSVSPHYGAQFHIPNQAATFMRPIPHVQPFQFPRNHPQPAPHPYPQFTPMYRGGYHGGYRR